jgi:hypothetical protein
MPDTFTAMPVYWNPAVPPHTAKFPAFVLSCQEKGQTPGYRFLEETL